MMSDKTQTNVRRRISFANIAKGIATLMYTIETPERYPGDANVLFKRNKERQLCSQIDTMGYTEKKRGAESDNGHKEQGRREAPETLIMDDTLNTGRKSRLSQSMINQTNFEETLDVSHCGNAIRRKCVVMATKNMLSAWKVAQAEIYHDNKHKQKLQKREEERELLRVKIRTNKQLRKARRPTPAREPPGHVSPFPVYSIIRVEIQRTSKAIIFESCDRLLPQYKELMVCDILVMPFLLLL